MHQSLYHAYWMASTHVIDIDTTWAIPVGLFWIAVHGVRIASGVGILKRSSRAAPIFVGLSVLMSGIGFIRGNPFTNPMGLPAFVVIVSCLLFKKE